jgi:hypothetical protein
MTNHQEQQEQWERVARWRWEHFPEVYESVHPLMSIRSLYEIVFGEKAPWYLFTASERKILGLV